MEVHFQVGAGEYFDHVDCELLKLRAALAAQIPASQFVRPGGVWEAFHSFAINGFHLPAQLVLIQKCGQAFIESRIVRIAVNLAAADRQRIHHPVQRAVQPDGGFA